MTDSGYADSMVTRPPTPLVPKGRRRRTSLRPLATGAYLPVEPVEPPKPPTRASRGLRVALHAALIAAVALAVARWVEPGRVLLPGARSGLWWAWSHQISGTGSSSYPMAGALEAAVAAGGEASGLAPPTVQLLATLAATLYALWGVSSFAGRFLRPLGATLAGVLAVVNPYVLALSDVRVLVLVGLAASLAGVVWSIADGRRVTPLALVLATVPVPLVAGEPFMLAALGLWLPAAGITAIATGRLPATLRLLRFGIWAVPLLLAVHLWWLAPAAQTFGPQREGVELTPQVDRSSLAAGAVLVPVAALGVAAVLDRLWQRARARRHSGARSWRKRSAEGLALAATVAALALPVPLRADLGDAPAPEVPAGWQAAATAVNTSPIEGRALVLPLAPADGGADDVPRRLLTRPVLQHTAPGTFRPAAAADRRIAVAARRLAAADTSGLDELGVSHILIRRDAAEAPDLARSVARLRGWRPVAHTDNAHVYERVRSAPLLRALPVSRSDPAPTITWRTLDSAHHAVTVDAATGPFVLTLSETFGPGWQLTGLPEGWSARHTVVDGYANGWLLDGTGSAHLGLAHRPSDNARLAAYASAATLALLAAVTLALRATRSLKTQQNQA